METRAFLSFNSASQTGLKCQVGMKLSGERNVFKPGRTEHPKYQNWTASWDGIFSVNIVVLVLLLLDLNSPRFEISMWMQRNLAHPKWTQAGVSFKPVWNVLCEGPLKLIGRTTPFNKLFLTHPISWKLPYKTALCIFPRAIVRPKF